MQILQIHSITRMVVVIVFEISSRSLDYPWCMELRDGSKYNLSLSTYNCSSLSLQEQKTKKNKFPFFKNKSFELSKISHNVNFHHAGSDLKTQLALNYIFDQAINIAFLTRRPSVWDNICNIFSRMDIKKVKHCTRSVIWSLMQI